MLVAAGYDVVRFEIPDRLSIIIFSAALGRGTITPDFVWISHLSAPIPVLIVGLLVFRSGMMGGADIKLLIAVSAWTGLTGLVQFIVAVIISGGVLAVILVLLRAVTAKIRNPDGLARIFRKGAPLPYAVAIAGGTIWWAAAEGMFLTSG